MQIPILIQRYLAAHKRLVVPQLGAFVVKEPGTVLFTELLKRDDGALRALLCEAGASELEAAGEIDRFVFEVRHAVEHGQTYTAAGLGVFHAGPNRTIAFRYEPAENAAAPEPTARPRAEVPATDVSPAEPAAAPRRATTPAEAEEERTHGRVSASAKRNPDPSLRGLRYGKPHKNTDAYTYVDRPVRRRGDIFIWIAVAVALLALAAIGFGAYREMIAQEAETEFYSEPSPAGTWPSDNTETL